MPALGLFDVLHDLESPHAEVLLILCAQLEHSAHPLHVQARQDKALGMEDKDTRGLTRT